MLILLSTLILLIIPFTSSFPQCFFNFNKHFTNHKRDITIAIINNAYQTFAENIKFLKSVVNRVIRSVEKKPNGVHQSLWEIKISFASLNISSNLSAVIIKYILVQYYDGQYSYYLKAHSIPYWPYSA